LLTLFLVILFVATPLMALLSFQDDCSDQICHIFMTNLFIFTSAIIVLIVFLITKLSNKVLSFGILYCEEVFLPPRFL
jgi:hypothetical protein